MADAKQALKTRATTKGMLTWLRNSITAETKKSEAKIKMAKCEEMWANFQTAQETIEAVVVPAENELQFMQECEAERAFFEMVYYEIVTKLQEIIDEAEDVQRNVAAQINAEVNNAIQARNNGERHIRQKLPEIKLPEFSGDFTKWLFFKNSFEATIHTNQQLSNVQKQQYLIGVLQGEARKVIQGFAISDASYTSAWKLLVDTYDNQMIIIENHLEELFKFPAIIKDNKSDSLRLLHFHIQTHTASLKAMKQPVEHWDTLIIHLAKKKLDFAEQRDWQEKTKDCNAENMPKLETFLKFLIERSQAYMLLAQHKTNLSSPKTVAKDKKYGNKVAMAVTQLKCVICNGSHPIYSCEDLIKQNPNGRRKTLMDKGLCLNCLKTGHFAKDCRSSKCKKCHRPHNTLLHEEQVNTNAEVTEEERSQQLNLFLQKESAPISLSVNVAQGRRVQILLSTALILVQDSQGRKVTCRALLDPGSQSNLMTEEVRKKLAVPCTKENVQITGVDNSKAAVRGTARLQLSSTNEEFQAEEHFTILPSITERLPQIKVELDKIIIPKNLQLADPTFNKPGRIDLLIGAGLYWRLVVGKPRSADGQPTLQNTRLGWIVGGEIREEPQQSETACYKVTNEQLSDQIERFWRQESIQDSLFYTKEEMECDRQFANTTSRDSTGRFMVRLPLKPDITLGESKVQALKRLEAVWRRLVRQPEIKTAYVDFMDEYQRLGHMTLVNDEQERNAAYFIPHQAVLRPESETSKVRVVFDASAKTTRGTSLNDKLMIGPNLQRDLVHIILRFRSHKYVVTSDVEKMYRQILVHPADRTFQQICWKEDLHAPVKVYQLNTVTYGTASAPYHAMKCLDELASFHSDVFPAAANAIKNDFYMDDCLSGGDSLEEVTQLRQQLQTVLSSGGMRLRKWRANNKRILEGLEDQEEGSLLVLDREEPCKTLGLLWNSDQDCLRFQTVLPKEIPRTKREVASKIAQTFDPLGLIAPVLIKGKMLMQLLWIDELEWDQQLAQEHVLIWEEYYSSLKYMNEIEVVRNFNFRNTSTTFNLFGFSDASEKAFGACIYAQYRTDDGCYVSNLVCARTRVAPLKTVSLPRLELEAALLLAKLLREVEIALGDRVEHVSLWSDSTIVLGWIGKEPRLLKTFVANRVCKIQQATEHGEWGHVSSEENPADILSRGMAAADLKDNTLWWNGPQWLQTSSPHPEYSQLPDENLPELRKATVTLTVTFGHHILHRFSSFSKLCRVIALIRRFINNCKSPTDKKIGPVQIGEIREAEQKVIELVQLEAFADVRKDLLRDRALPRRSPLKSLSPFVDKDGLIKVGGRLRYSELSEERKHPTLLPSGHHVTKLILGEEHRRLKHCPPEQLLHSIREKYWPLAGRRMVTGVVKRCLECFRFNPAVPKVRMGELPRERVTPSLRPFVTTGVDYAGPISVRESRRRGRIHVSKGYVAVFTCFKTKAVHLEAVTDLTTEAFLAALQRFTARRGLCSTIVSDNGKNFVGADNTLQEIQSFLERESPTIAASLSRQEIKWEFIPPRSPHFGGLWEAAVKAMKRHLLTETQGRVLTFEEMCTLLCDIEAILNSRPLTPLPGDPNDLQVLTPAHFMIGGSLIQPVQYLVSHEPDNRLSRWQLLQKVRQGLWQRWQKEYLQELQRRAKWHETGRRIEVDTLVLLMEDNVPPVEWPRGRILEVHPGADGEVRVVTVRTSHGVYKRSVKKISPLPLSEGDEET